MNSKINNKVFAKMSLKYKICFMSRGLDTFKK